MSRKPAPASVRTHSPVSAPSQSGERGGASSAAAPPARAVRCPACGGPSLYSPANRWRPFCSERCKLQDLGAWASEQFRVEVREPDGSDADPAIDNASPGPRVH